jgi:hypothetical protein
MFRTTNKILQPSYLITIAQIRNRWISLFNFGIIVLSVKLREFTNFKTGFEDLMLKIISTVAQKSLKSSERLDFNRLLSQELGGLQ